MYFDTPVTINEVTATSVRKIKYSPDYFNFGNVQHDKDTVKDLGFAGFKVLYPINSKDKNDEIVSMLGASYFRVLGQGQVYGLSARGLAIDTALPSGEEFPRFREFWIERPKATDKRLTIYALLDSHGQPAPIALSSCRDATPSWTSSPKFTCVTKSANWVWRR